MNAYPMVSLPAPVLNNTSGQVANQSLDPIVQKFQEHDWWDKGQGWKNILNNLSLVIQPFIFFNLIKSWLIVFPISYLSMGFFTLIALMNRMRGAIPNTDELLNSYEKPEDLLGESGILKQLTKALVERCLEEEMKTHLEEQRTQSDSQKAKNRRNGHSKKTIKGEARRS